MSTDPLVKTKHHISIFLLSSRTTCPEMKDKDCVFNNHDKAYGTS